MDTHPQSAHVKPRMRPTMRAERFASASKLKAVHDPVAQTPSPSATAAE